MMTCELISAHTPTIIIYDSTIVDSQHLALLRITFTNRQRTRTVFPAINIKLTQRLDTTQSPSQLTPDTSVVLPTPTTMTTPTLHDTIVTKIRQINPCENRWNPDKYTTTIGTQLYVKIKSHQLRSNGYPKYNAKP